MKVWMDCEYCGEAQAHRQSLSREGKCPPEATIDSQTCWVGGLARVSQQQVIRPVIHGVGQPRCQFRHLEYELLFGYLVTGNEHARRMAVVLLCGPKAAGRTPLHYAPGSRKR